MFLIDNILNYLNCLSQLVSQLYKKSLLFDASAHTGLLPGPHFENQCCGAWALGRRVLEFTEQVLFRVQARAKTVNILILIVMLIINIHIHIHAKLISFAIGSNSWEYLKP